MYRHPNPAITFAIAILCIPLIAVTTNSLVQAQDNDFEVIPAGEPEQIDEIALDTITLQDIRAENHPGNEERILRGVHAKSHGCVKADFVVESQLREELKVGLFSEPGRRYEAMIRFSNASVVIEDDLKADQMGVRQNGSRGMAVKILGVDGDVLLRDNGDANQDFLMINTPEFAFSDVRGYHRLTKALLSSPNGDDPKAFFLPAIAAAELKRLGEPKDGESAEDKAKREFFQSIAKKPDFKKHVQEAGKTLKIIKEKIEAPRNTVLNPLEAQYFGAAPFAFGPDHVMKVSAAPCQSPNPFPDAAGLTQKERDTLPPNYLRDALTSSMKGDEDQCFNFMVQVRGKEDLDQLGIEDATTTWPEEVKEYETVAKLHIEAPQDPSSKTMVDQCEGLAFSPWQGLVAHKPLGGINRLRKSVYTGSATHRGASKN